MPSKRPGLYKKTIKNRLSAQQKADILRNYRVPEMIPGSLKEAEFSDDGRLNCLTTEDLEYNDDLEHEGYQKGDGRKDPAEDGNDQAEADECINNKELDRLMKMELYILGRVAQKRDDDDTDCTEQIRKERYALVLRDILCIKLSGMIIRICGSSGCSTERSAATCAERSAVSYLSTTFRTETHNNYLLYGI
jgi:hypothetical protein